MENNSLSELQKSTARNNIIANISNNDDVIIFIDQLCVIDSYHPQLRNKLNDVNSSAMLNKIKSRLPEILNDNEYCHADKYKIHEDNTIDTDLGINKVTYYYGFYVKSNMFKTESEIYNLLVSDLLMEGFKNKIIELYPFLSLAYSDNDASKMYIEHLAKINFRIPEISKHELNEKAKEHFSTKKNKRKNKVNFIRHKIEEYEQESNRLKLCLTDSRNKLLYGILTWTIMKNIAIQYPFLREECKSQAKEKGSDQWGIWPNDL